MTLEEAIIHAREKANENRKKAEKNYTEALNYQGCIGEKVYMQEYESCKECANEHEQLAEWLEELQERRRGDM